MPSINRNQFIDKYNLIGPYRFYKFLIAYAINILVEIENNEYKGIGPHLEFLGYYDKFLRIYRQNGEEIYLELAKVFRKAAHKIYRLMLKKKLIPVDNKFLNMVN